MYFTEIDPGALVIMYILGAGLTLVILFLIIKGAVKSGTSDLLTQLKFHNNLKCEEMQKNGWEFDRLRVIREDSEQENDNKA